MMQEHGEKKVKSLQKEYLFWVENHAVLQNLHPTEFNAVRKKVFRQTWDAYRLGVIGLGDVTGLFNYFFSWMDKLYTTEELHERVQNEIAEQGLRITLEAFRVGAMVAACKELEDAL